MKLKAGRTKAMKGYVVAINQTEADGIAWDRHDVVHETRAEAETHLKFVKAHPTDSYYANQYCIYKVEMRHQAQNFSAGDEMISIEELRRTRVVERISGSELCKVTGIQRARLSLLENGSVTPRADELRRLLKALGVIIREKRGVA